MKRKIVIFFLLLATPAFAAGKSVYVLLSSDSGIYEEGLAGIRSALASEDIKFGYLNIISAEHSDLPAFFRDLEKNSAVLIALGPQATEESLRSVTNIPVVFSLVNNPKSFTGNKRACGVSMDVPLSIYFQTLRELSPDARFVKAFVSTSDGEFLASEGQYSDLNFKLVYRVERLNDVASFESVLSQAAGKVQAIYMPPDALYNSARFQTLSDFSKTHHVVLMTPFRSLVKLGATFGYTPDYGKIGMLTGQMVRRIMNGYSTCEQENILLPDPSSFFFELNEAYAKESGLSVPPELAERARLMRLLQSGVRMTADNKFQTAQSIFMEILKRDPKNTTAQYYLDYILSKLTGDQIERLLAEAQGDMKRENFPAARALFMRVLSINPKIKEAEEGADKAALMQSEKERQMGNAMFTQGKPYDGIRMIQNALATYPTNTNAQSDLNRMRSTQLGVVPKYFEEGLQSYNGRDYETSEQIFANILLVDLGNKQATEYLRLSKLKKEAMQKLVDKLQHTEN